MPGKEGNKLADEVRLSETAEATLERLMREHGTEVLRLVRFFVKDAALAEDITQDVFVKVFRNLAQFRGESAIRTWIFKIAVNECKGVLRSWSFRRIFPRSEPPERPDRSAEAAALASVQRDHVFRLVMQLPARYRQVIALHYYADLSIAEVANVLGLTEGAVRTRLHRARQLLKSMMEQEDAGWTSTEPFGS